MELKDIMNRIEEMNGNQTLTISIRTEQKGDYDKNRLRWKNAILEAKQQSESLDIDMSKELSQAESIVDDSNFWAHQGLGLVGYFTGEKSEMIKLNHSTVPLVDINTTANKYPIISEKSTYSSMYVFCVSKNKTALFLIENDKIKELDISKNVVNNYEEAMNFDDTTQSLQHRSVGGDAIFHGNGTETENSGIRIEQYLRRVDDGLMEVIQGKKIPLVLACIEEYHSIYQKITRYHRLHPEMIAGNPDQLEPSQILEKAKCLLRDNVGEEVENFIDNFEQISDRRLVFNSIDEMRSSIHMKNIDSLLINEAKLAEMSLEDRIKITRDLVGAYEQGTKLVCIHDSDSDHIVHGIRRFQMETSMA